MSKLLIISHTEHFQSESGSIIGWEPTIREINSLIKLFDTIYHIAPLYENQPHCANGSYEKGIIFIPIKPSGGPKIFDKIKIIINIPKILITIIKMINKVDWIHFRSPANLGIFVIPLISLLRKKKKWIKYAGNWIQKDIPVSFALQRWWLRNNFNNSIVTINGKWDNQPKHLVSFLNPCINDNELIDANKIGFAKKFNFPINLCFVGRYDQNKGYQRLIKVLESLGSVSWIEKINFVGGSENEDYPKMSLKNKRINFCGWLNREKLNKIYEKSHFIILPTKSEGFPKVLAEAGAFGCIPIVSDISPVNQLIINDHNGFLLFDLTIDTIKDCLLQIPDKEHQLKDMSNNIIKISNQFTYYKYSEAINKLIING